MLPKGAVCTRVVEAAPMAGSRSGHSECRANASCFCLESRAYTCAQKCPATGSKHWPGSNFAFDIGPILLGPAHVEGAFGRTPKRRSLLSPTKCWALSLPKWSSFEPVKNEIDQICAGSPQTGLVLSKLVVMLITSGWARPSLSRF